jgi:hypothetical protein
MTITAQAPISPSEQPIVSEGWHAYSECLPFADNPYPAVCQQSLRDHWLWERGWYEADKQNKEKL